ncbi:MAG: TnpV protein [Deltaproteobacteria bacterium]|nr:MAG: TnpV protein [Deltaproteobacteria bacterium]
MSELKRFGIQARDHLKENRPKLYRHLKRKGQLEKYCLDVQNRVEDQIERLMKKGLQYHEAWLIASEVIYVPSEDEQPILGVTENFFIE